MKRRTVIAARPVALAGCAGVMDDGDADAEFLDTAGGIEIGIDDEAFDLPADRFQAEHPEEHSPAFHLHEFDDRWHMGGRESVTAAEGVDPLPRFKHRCVGGARVIRIDDRTYDEREGGEIEFAVDGEPVDPIEYELRDGDSLLVTIST